MQNKPLLQNVAHMYYGCFIYNTKTKQMLMLNNHTHTYLLNDDRWCLLLRKPNTIQNHEYISCGVRSDVEFETKIPTNIALFKSMAQQVKYLCSRGIDLFNLIQEQEAIDVNTVNEKLYN